MAGLTCWMGTDVVTQPMMREHEDDGGRKVVDVTLVVGVYCDTGSPVPSFKCRVFNGGWTDLPGGTSPARVDDDYFQQRTAGRISPSVASADDVEFAAWGADIALARDRAPQNAYYTHELKDLARGGLLEVTLTVAADGTTVTEQRAYWLIAPKFDADKIKMARTTTYQPPAAWDAASPNHLYGEGVAEELLADDQWWVLMVHGKLSPGNDTDRDGTEGRPADEHNTDEDNGFITIRLDMLSTTAPIEAGGWPRLPNVTVAVNDVAIRADYVPSPPTSDEEIQRYIAPRVDRSDDSIIISFPRKALPQVIDTVGVQTAPGTPREDLFRVALDGASDREWKYWPTGLMILQYCNQGWNDLFAAPVTVYDPPRDYIGITFEDEDGRFSSDPLLVEDGIPDGYQFALEAQRDYEVKTHWALNGGALGLMAQGLESEKFKLLTAQVGAELLSPAIAGFGANRPPYYREESQLKEIEYGVALVSKLLPRSGKSEVPLIYYPDQRIYLASPGEIAAYKDLATRDVIGYIVLDRSNIAEGQRLLFADWSDDNPVGNHVWCERATGLRVLPIEDTMRDSFVNQSKDEASRGQVAYRLRRLFMAAVRARAGTARRLFIYGDDLDHACGDGWFDGQRITYTHNYRASLRWISRHPWVRAWQVDDEEFAHAGFEQAEPIFISSAVDPTVDPGGAETIDVEGNRIHFNAWYKWWYNKQALWLDRPLGAVSDELQAALIAWPKRFRNQLYDLAWCYFLAGTHESMWNNQAIGPGYDPNKDLRTWEPIDFVVSETLQQRNAWVALNASVWAQWAESPAATSAETFVIARHAAVRPQVALVLVGVSEEILVDREVSRIDSRYPYAIPRTDRFAHWDRDWWPTVVLYNRRACVVFDVNGGVISHIFCRLGERSEKGRVISVAGTFKTHQFLIEPGPHQIECDGDRIQNNVRTPNHGYVGSDISVSDWRRGWFRADNSLATKQCWYPNNFDAYTPAVGSDWVTFAFQPESELQVPVDPDTFAAYCASSDARSLDGLSAHAGSIAGGAFSKTFKLTMQGDVPVVEVQYHGVGRGHIVSNEFAVNLWEAVFTGSKQQLATAEQNGITVSGPEADVTIRPLKNCAFVAGVGARPEDVQTMYASGLHRVLTDDLRIWCEQGGDFSYEIRLPT